MRRYAPDPGGELTALPRPHGWILGTGKEGRKGNERASGKTKEKKKEIKGKKEGRKGEGDKGKGGGEREGKEKKGKNKRKGRNFVQL